jgi:hypothetical protein
LTHASWPLPEHLPSLWGAGARGKMARALFARHIPSLPDAPVFLGVGSSGITPFPVPLEPGACYVATVALTHGHARSLQLRTMVGSRESTDERGAAEEAALTAFCAEGSASARLEVHARGTGIGWGVALYRVRGGIWEPGR